MIQRDETRSDFESAAAAFRTVLSGITAEQWGQPGLGEWSVRDLAGHTSRALLTVETYLRAGASADQGDRASIETPQAYFLAGARGGIDQAAVAARGREAGAKLGADPVATVAGLVARVLELVGTMPDDAVVATPVARMRLATYLPTRTFELAVHTLDLAAATGAAVPDELAGPVRAALALAAAVAAETPDAPAVLLALAGRRPLPAGFSVV